ncbi:MAG TPA: DUF6665 family protein [Longimicrobiaceae bacterium]|nr:DUF6665 family protein [Longimicrobiaceae bacterium]
MPDTPLSRHASRNLESVQAEIVQEKAAALARMATRLGEALARLEAFGTEPQPGGDAPAERRRLVAAAGEALWYYVVQREACGMRDVESVLREFRVPREVYLRMGLASIPPEGRAP